MSLFKSLFCMVVLPCVMNLSAEEGLKFAVPDSVAPVTAKTNNDTVVIQKTPEQVLPIEIPAQQTIPSKNLDLDRLTARDTESFDVYSERIALVNDSINKELAAVDFMTEKVISRIVPITPKGEFEKQAVFEKRKTEWEKGKTEAIQVACKPLNERLTELNKAKKKLEDIQVSMLGTIEIQTEPSGASITLGEEKNGISPVTIQGIIPGKITARISKNNFNPLDTVIDLKPGNKLSLFFALSEKNLFSMKDEINLIKILTKDSNTILIYQKRIERIRNRQKQVDGEIKIILAKFPDTFPRLAPQKAGETTDQFNARKERWTKDGLKQYNILKSKYMTYRARLDRAVEVLKDYITQIEAATVLETPKTATIALGEYDSEKERFALQVTDTSGSKTPFMFFGTVAMPIATAKTINHNVTDFSLAVLHLNYPFMTDSGNVNLAVSKVDLMYHSKPVIVSGSFKEVPKYMSMPGYPQWKSHADSLLNGTLKVQNLDASYAIQWNPPQQTDDENKFWGWRGWSRVVLFTASAVFGGMAIYENHEASDKAENAHPTTEAQAKNIRSDIQDHDDMRDVMIVCAGVSVGLGLITFAF